MTAWEIKGREFGNCNCDYSCPCQFNALPSNGHCRGLAVYDIEAGFHGTTRLDGLRAAGIFRWPGPIHEGKGEGVHIIDQRATPAQREALSRILRGEDTEPFATVFSVFASTCDRLHQTAVRRYRVRARHRGPHSAGQDRRRPGDAGRADPQSCHRRGAPGPHRAAERLRIRRGRDRARLVEDRRAGRL